MNRAWQLGTGLVLTALAGYIDALGFVRLGGLYTSFMSGNTTQLSVFLAHRAFPHMLMPAFLVGGFLAGAVLASGLSILVPSPWTTPSVLGCETLLILAALGIGVLGPESGSASILMAMAMGAQNGVLAQVKGFRAGTTFVTGALFSFGQKVTEAITRTGPAFGWVGDGAVWAALLLGAFAGAVAYDRLDLYALAIPAAIAGLLAAVAAIFALRHRPMLPEPPAA